MHLKDILDLDSYDLAPDSKVEIFDMDDFDVRLSEEYQIVKLTRNEE